MIYFSALHKPLPHSMSAICAYYFTLHAPTEPCLYLRNKRDVNSNRGIARMFLVHYGLRRSEKTNINRRVTRNMRQVTLMGIPIEETIFRGMKASPIISVKHSFNEAWKLERGNSSVAVLSERGKTSSTCTRPLEMLTFS